MCRELAFDPSLLSTRHIEALEGIHIETDRVLDQTRRTIGFELERFEDAFAASTQNVVHVSECTEGALRSSLEQVRDAGGGRVELPACRLSVAGELLIPSRTILAGQGRRTSVLVFQAGDKSPWGSVLRIQSVAHVIVRDIGIERPSPSLGGDQGVAINMADNVLLERISVSGVREAFWVQHSTNFTIRYSEIRDLAKQIGGRWPIKALSFGECDQGSGSTATTASCEATNRFLQAGQPSTGTLWTAGFAFYSNTLSGADSWGSSSGSVGEIAGNRYEFAAGQLKIDDGWCVLVHHNVFSNVRGSVVFRAATEVIDRGTRWLGFYDNLIEDNVVPGGYLLNFTNGDHVYILNNRFRNNTGIIAWRPRGRAGSDVYMCPFGEENTPRDTSAHGGAPPLIRLLETYDPLCQPDGGRLLFRN